MVGDLSVVNVVGGGSLYREFDLKQVFLDFPHRDIEYEPETFAAVVIRYDSPQGTVMLYSSGTYSLAGARSAEGAQEVVETFVQQLDAMMSENLDQESFEIRYMVGTGDLGFELDLNQISIALGIAQTEYEPEQFPGLFYYPTNEDWFCLLFTSGKVVFSGIESKDELRKAYNMMRNRINNLVNN